MSMNFKYKKCHKKLRKDYNLKIMNEFKNQPQSAALPSTQQNREEHSSKQVYSTLKWSLAE